MRVDSAIYNGMQVSPYYDSMLAKVIAWGKDRDEAIHRMRRALHELIIEGITSTADFHKSIIETPAFLKGEYDTSFLSKVMHIG